MTRLEATLAKLARDLESLGLRWALVGGLAVSARVEPRFTRDVDVAVVAADDAEAEELVRSLLGRGYRVLATVEQDARGRLATVRLLPPGSAPDDVVVDLLLASSGVEAEIAESAEWIDVVPGLTIPVARIGDLIALKLLARDDAARPQDVADLRALRPTADLDELARTEILLGLITRRGFHRDRDLLAALAEYRATLAT